MNLANQLTTARMAMVPVFVVLMATNHVAGFLAAYVVFTVATITDYYDGKIARARNQITNFGKLLDPVADKVLLTAAFVTMMEVPELRVPAWTVVVILAREFLITGARSLAASGGIVIAANRYGKTKAVLQMVYVFVFLLLVVVERGLVLYAPAAGELFGKILAPASLAAIVIVALYTVYSGVQFARLNWRALSLGSST